MLNMKIEKLLVTVIVPVFNAEKTLNLSLDSIKNQTYSNIEIVFINDCSTDSSSELLYTFQKDNPSLSIVILDHEKNMGVASARNSGLGAAKGDYIYFLDADDQLDANAISEVMKVADSADYDIIGFNWYLTFSTNERRMNQPSFTSPEEALKLMLSGAMRWNLWLFVVKRSLYERNAIRFIPGMNMGEDLMIMVKLFTYSKNVYYINEAFYHYGQSNASSLTKTYSSKHILEVTENVNEVEKFINEYNPDFVDQNYLYYLKLNIKLPLIMSNKESQYIQWLNWFPESNPYIMKNKFLPYRTRLVQWMASKQQFWFLKVYNFVFTTVYGRLYK